MAALAPWRDEKKPSKPGEEENTGRAEVKLPRPVGERERGREKEESRGTFFSPPADCGVTLCEMYIQTSGKLVSSLQTAVTWFHVSYFTICRVCLTFDACFIFSPQVLCHGELLYLNDYY